MLKKIENGPAVDMPGPGMNQFDRAVSSLSQVWLMHVALAELGTYCHLHAANFDMHQEVS